MNLFGNQDPQNLFGDLLAQFGYSMLAGKGNLGQNIGNAGLSNMQYRQQQEQMAKERERQAMQDQMLKMRVEQFQGAQQQNRDRMSALKNMPNFSDPRSSMPSLAPTVENAQAMSNFKAPNPYQTALKRAEYLRSKGLEKDALGYEARAEKLKPQQKVVGSALLEVGDSGVKELYRDPMAGMNNLLVPGADGKPTVNQPLLAAKQQIASAGRPAVTTNVMPPQDTFKNSMSLKKDFDDQPEVKGFKEVQGAWDQISGALKNPSAANDLAAATKFMKMLDPGSVVRESELMLAMQATGKLDQFLNYANRIQTGQKLTPAQRKDFYSSGKMLYDAAKGRYDQATQQYQGIAKQYNLDSQFLPKNAQPGANDPLGIR